MNLNEAYFLGVAILLILCVLASKASARLGIPTLVVFLAIGMLAGSEGLGKIEFNDTRSTQSMGIIALAYILFSGGLDTKWTSIRPIMKEGVVLATFGVLFTCLLLGAFGYYILDFTLTESLLLGAIVSSTDAGAVFTVLRSRNVHLKGNLKPLLELESGSNDPMAVFLTTGFLQMMVNPAFGLEEMIPLLFQQMIIGAFVGFSMGKIIVWLMGKVKLQIEGLYIVLSIALVIFVYSLTQALYGNGFLAVYIAGVVLGNHNFVFKKSLTVLHDGLSWLMQSAMFLTLGLLVYPSQIVEVSQTGILFAGFMILLARPISVFLCLFFSKLNFKEKVLISWVGLRGSVPVIMATYPLMAGVERAGFIFNIVFFVALSSLILQGTTIPLISRWLKVDDPFAPSKRNYSFIPGHLKDIVTMEVPYNSPLINKTIVDLKLPHNKILIVGIERNGEVIIPRGSTILEKHDKISLMADDETLADFYEKLWAPEYYSRPTDESSLFRH